MDESYFQNIKRCFESLKFEKKRNRSKSCRSLNTRQRLPLTFPACAGRCSSAGALGRQGSAEEQRCPTGAGTADCPAPSSLSSSACRDFYMKLNLIIKLDWGRETLQRVFTLVDMPTRHTWKSLLVSCYKGLFRNSCHWRSLIKDSQHCDFPEERGPWFGELSNLSVSIETGCRRKHSSWQYFCSLNLSPSNTSFSQSFKRVKVTPCTGAWQAHCWPRERRGAWFPCL